MIDIHCHILPGLDDGPAILEESLEMGRIAAAEGVETLVATPHCLNGIYANDQGTILPALNRLREALLENNIPITVLPGADIHLQPELAAFVSANPALLLGGRYFLLELPSQSLPPGLPEFLFKIGLTGLMPIITHPERNLLIQGNPALAVDWVRAGALLQITAMSVTGEFGRKVQDCARFLITRGLIQVLASDAHSSDRRPPLLSRARARVEQWGGAALAHDLVEGNPGRIVRGDILEADLGVRDMTEGQINTRGLHRRSGLKEKFKTWFIPG
jgi:protein-tyrosine phosphatase